MPKLFKDFNKDAKDLLTKDFSKPGAWKVESKVKAKNDVMLNPVADAKGITVNVEYNLPQYKLKTKTALTAANVKPKVTWEDCGHKVELTVNSLKADTDFVATYEGNVAGVQIHDSVTKSGGTCGLSYSVPNANIDVGFGINYGFSQFLKGWGAGVRYADKAGRVLSLGTCDLKSYTTGFVMPVTVADHKVKVGTQVVCGQGKCDFGVGAEVAACCGFTIKANIDNKMKVGLAVIKKFAEGWKAAVSMESTECCKFGVTLTRE